MPIFYVSQIKRQIITCKRSFGIYLQKQATTNTNFPLGRSPLEVVVLCWTGGRGRFAITVYLYGEASYLYGEASHLYGEASHLYGEASYLYGEASYLYGEASYLYGEASYLYGEASYLYGEASHLYGERSGLQGASDFDILYGEHSDLHGEIAFPRRSDRFVRRRRGPFGPP